MSVLTLVLTACGWWDEPPPPPYEPPDRGDPVRPEPYVSTAVVLEAQDPTVVQLPPSSRPGGAPASARIPLTGPFNPAPPSRRDRRRAADGPSADTYAVRLPVHPSLLPSRDGGPRRVGNHAPPTMSVEGPSGPLPFARRAAVAGSWGFDASHVYIGVPEGAPAPDPADYTLVFDRAAEVENSWNLATSGQSPEAFLRRTIVLDDRSHRGLFLPAPASVQYTVQVPERGVLTFTTLRLPPNLLAEEASDGATVTVTVVADDKRQELSRTETRLAALEPARVDLSAWAGKTVELVLSTEPGDHATFDYVLLEDPVVYTPKDDPLRMLLVFVDTLRPDHLGFMGYERATTPNLDKWAKGATKFPNARTVAPWTLPSALSALSGEHPEDWPTSASLAERLAKEGWRTDAFVTNAFLSHPFDAHRGFARYRYNYLQDAPTVVKRAQRAVRAAPDRDLLLLVHLMEPHLPYEEPEALQELWAGPKPAGLREPLARGAINEEWSPSRDGFAEVRQYLIDRYDQNIRAVDEALPPLLREVGHDATVALFSDHGEAFWEHGVFEHGHDFHDELLKVVFAIRSPYMPWGEHLAPASLLDLTPTLLELVGLPHEVGAGRSLVPVAWYDRGYKQIFIDRQLVFGRPLYGSDGWGVVHVGDRKWFDRDGVQTLYDLPSDPGEQVNVIDGWTGPEDFPRILEEAYGSPVHRVWRVDLRNRHTADVTLHLSHPEGIEAAWLAYDPRGSLSRPHPELTEGRVSLVVPHHDSAVDVLYLKPSGDPLKPGGLAISYFGPGLTGGQRRGDPAPVTPSPAERDILLRVGDARFSAIVDLAWVPEPRGTAVPGFHPEVEQQLRELGYVDP